MRLELITESRKVRYFTRDQVEIFPGSKRSDGSRINAYLLSINGNQVWIPEKVVKYAEIVNTETGAVNKFYWIIKDFWNDKVKMLRAGKTIYGPGDSIKLPEPWKLHKGTTS